MAKRGTLCVNKRQKGSFLLLLICYCEIDASRCWAEPNNKKSYSSTEEKDTRFFYLLSVIFNVDVYYISPEKKKKMLYMCVYIESKWWISSCASCHVGDMPSDMALAPFLLSQIFDSDGKTSFPRRSQPEKQKRLLKHVPYVYICILRRKLISIQPIIYSTQQRRSGVRWFLHGSLVPRQMLCTLYYPSDF